MRIPCPGTLVWSATGPRSQRLRQPACAGTLPKTPIAFGPAARRDVARSGRRSWSRCASKVGGRSSPWTLVAADVSRRTGLLCRSFITASVLLYALYDHSSRQSCLRAARPGRTPNPWQGTAPGLLPRLVSRTFRFAAALDFLGHRDGDAR